MNKEKKAQGIFKLSFLSSSESKIIRNDFSHIWGSKGMRVLLILLPIVMAVLIPIAFFVIIVLSEAETTAVMPSLLKSLLADSAENLNYRQMMSHAFVTLICPIIYLSIPVISSVAAASNIFVTETENNTLETLMLSPVSSREIFNAKVTGSVLISIVISLISFIAFAITASVGNFVLWTPFFFTPKWLILILGIMPALSVFCVILVAAKLSKIHSTKESLKIMGYFILGITLFYLLQLAGVYIITAQLLLGVGLLLFGADIVLFNFSWRDFTPENLLGKQIERQN